MLFGMVEIFGDFGEWSGRFFDFRGIAGFFFLRLFIGF